MGARGIRLEMLLRRLQGSFSTLVSGLVVVLVWDGTDGSFR